MGMTLPELLKHQMLVDRIAGRFYKGAVKGCWDIIA
jgi:hypothetical protein